MTATGKASRKRPGWKISATSAENARRVLPWLASSFFEAGREAVAIAPAPRGLHKLRLKGKRLRYCLELFQPCYGPGLDHRLLELKKLQTYLGNITDCDMTARLIQREGLTNEIDAKRFLEFLELRKQENTAGFVDHWRACFDAPGQLESWLFYLKNYAGRANTASSEREAAAPERAAREAVSGE